MASLSRAALARPAILPVAEQRSGAPQETRRGPAARSVGPHDDDGSRLHLGDTQTVFTARAIIDDSADSRTVRRRQADALRAYGRTLAEPDSAVAKCGRVLRASEAVLVRTGDRASWSGLVTCGSVWACVPCATRIQLERSREVSLLVERARAAGLSASLCTFTVRHGLGHELRDMRRGLMDAWSSFQRRAVWLNARKRHSVETVRAVEVKYGANGWHPHIHVLMLSTATADELATMQIQFSDVWREVVVLKLGRAHEPDDEHGCVITPAHSAEYLTKMGLEVAYSASKMRGASRTPFELLSDASRGDTRSRALFVAYTRAMKGARQLEWSRGLRDRFGLGETSDEALVERITEAESSEPLLALNRRAWNAVNAAGGVLFLVELAERGASPTDLRAVVDRLMASVSGPRIPLARRLIREHERQAG